ncbi:MAG TPA: hypothetical protein VFD17_07235 [Clostridia bacterium]|nr:hypothetical protein [Clostridia bacterium]
MDIKITIENLDEILKSIDQLAEATALVGTAIAYKNNMNKTAKAAAAIIDEINKEETEPEEKVTESDEKATDPKEEPTEPEEKVVAEGPPAVTIEDVRELFVTKNSIKGNTAKLKAILDEFGVKKVTDLEEKDFPEVLEKLGAL